MFDNSFMFIHYTNMLEFYKNIVFLYSKNLEGTSIFCYVDKFYHTEVKVFSVLVIIIVYVVPYGSFFSLCPIDPPFLALNDHVLPSFSSHLIDENMWYLFFSIL